MLILHLKRVNGSNPDHLLAKQVLSQLSYTPKVTAQPSFYSIYAANSSPVSRSVFGTIGIIEAFGSGNANP